MNLLNQIRVIANRIEEIDNSIPTRQIVLHLERAERLYELAHKENDDDFYTDIIYRTNQVYEGVLRVAYMVLNSKTEKQTSNERTVDIEDFLIDQKILKERVTKQLKIYRQDWRNPSTHDFKLFFSENESILAISSVSVFVFVLLNQVNHKLIEKIEQKRVQEHSQVINGVINSSKTNKEKITSLIVKFNSVHKSLIESERTKEFEIIAALTVFLGSSKAITVKAEQLIKMKPYRLRVDMIIEYEGDKYLLEIKRPNQKLYRRVDEKTFFMMGRLKIKTGFVYSPNSSEDLEIISQPNLLGEELIYIG